MRGWIVCFVVAVPGWSCRLRRRNTSAAARRYSFAHETVDADGLVGEFTSLALDAQGNPASATAITTNLDLKYAAKSGGTWTIETVDSAGAWGISHRWRWTSRGTPDIGYRDLANADLKYA